MLSRTCLTALLLIASATISAFAITHHVPTPAMQGDIDLASAQQTTWSQINERVHLCTSVLCWTRIYPYTTSDASIWGGGPSAQQTLDGGYIVATKGRSVSEGGGDNLLVVKTDDLGEILWTQSYDVDAFMTSDVSIQQLRDGGYVLCGGGAFMNTVWGWLMRLDAAGDSLWAEHTGCLNTCIQQTADDGFIVAGYGFVDTGGEWPILFKTDGDGNVEWWRDWPQCAGFNHVVELRDGSGYAMVGWSCCYDVLFVKTDLNGIEVARRTYGQNEDRGSEICETSDGGFIMCGHSGDDAYLIRTDAAGDTLWTKRDGAGPGYCAMAHSVIETSRGSFLAVGGGWGNHEMWILETDANGDTLCSRSYDLFPDLEYARRILPTSDGGCIIAGGGRRSPDHSFRFFLMNLEESVTDVTGSDATTPSCVYLHPNVPNPFNPTTTIRFSVPEPGDVLLRIYDPTGRLLRTLVQAPRPAGIHSVLWNGTNQAGVPVAGGVYFYQLVLNGETQTRRMILAR